MLKTKKIIRSLSFGVIYGVALLLLPTMLQAQICRSDSIPASTPVNRFTINGDGTVTDNRTGLMWKQCAEGQTGADCREGSPITFYWQEALEWAQMVNEGSGSTGYTDWRIPNIKELLSLVERQCVYPAINLEVFPTPNPVFLRPSFWSSSPVTGIGVSAWGVDFYDGMDRQYTKLTRFQVRLVRGGQ